MRFVKPEHKILTPITSGMIHEIERAARVCYASEMSDNDTDSQNFICKLIKRGHETPLEHVSISVAFTCDRGVSHELVRHRLASFCQESTRYVLATKPEHKTRTQNQNTKPEQETSFPSDDEHGIAFVVPSFLDKNSTAFSDWSCAMWHCEKAYTDMIARGCTPGQTRSVLPNSTATRVIMTANIREWRHVLRLRTAPAAHEQMRELMIPLLDELKHSAIACLFEDI